MHIISLIQIFITSSLVALAAADCCWGDNWADTNWLWLKWDEAAGVVRCGIEGNLQPGTKCSSVTYKDDSGYTNGLVNVTFGSDPQPFKFRIGIQPGSCDLLPNEKVISGWEGWGAYMWEGHEFTAQRLEACTQANSA